MPRNLGQNRQRADRFLFMTDQGWACLSMFPEYYINPFE